MAGNDPKLTLARLKGELQAAADPERARNSAWFFKTGKGEYGEGDRFLGNTVPVQRRIARRYRTLPLGDVKKLLSSPLHEHRFTALEILVARYEQGDEPGRQEIFDFYLANAARVNQWDLVDTSAPYIVGAHLRERPRDILYRLARSESLWERRIAIVSTMMFIREGDLKDALAISAKLLGDEHDLIHKAAGWMLREVGIQSRRALIEFLRRHYDAMPRTMLRYAIERFPEAERKGLLRGVMPG